MKTLKLSIFCTLLLPVLAFGQTRQSIDFVGGIEYSFRTLGEGKNYDLPVEVDLFGQGDVAKLNWRLGFNYNRGIGQKWFLKTGVRLASVGYGSEWSDLRWGTQHDGLGGFDPDAPTDPTEPNTIEGSIDYYFLEIPLVARYELSEHRLTPFVELGFAPSFYATTRSVTETNLSREVNFARNDSEKFNHFHLVGVASFGLNYELNAGWQLFGQPTLRYHITRLYEGQINEHLYNYGLELGVRRWL